MPLKQKPQRTRHSKSYLKVYAPYLPLLLILGLGLFVSMRTDFKQYSNQVLSYAADIKQEGLLSATNKQREANHAAPLKENILLDKAAQAKAEDMAKRNYWSHETPDGKEPWYFIDQTGYKYFKSAENLAYGFKTSDSTISGWMNSSAHRANLLDTKLSEVGFGIVNVPNYQNEGPETIVVAMYGQPASPAESVAGSQTTSSNGSSQKKISYVQAITDGKAPWSGFAAGLLIGGVVVYLIVTHATRIRRTLRISERFIVKHPLLDITLIALLALAAILSQTAGMIY